VSSTPTPAWDDGDDSGGWNGTKLALVGLGFAGLAAAAYLMRRRSRQRTRYARFVETASDLFDSASDIFDVAADFARERHPAWWASLATAALPIAYYAWPRPRPTYQKQARGQFDDLANQIEQYLHSLTGMMPSTWATSSHTPYDARRYMPSSFNVAMPAHFSLPGKWGRSSDWSLPSDWSIRSDVAWPAGLIAAGALALYLARRPTFGHPARTRIADVMTRQPRVIQPDATIADAAAMMRRLDVGALPVCDGSRLIGMLTDRDVTIRATADGRDPHLTPVRDVMSPGVAWATEDDPVEEAARIMREHRIRRLPIVDQRHSLVGVVSLGDLAVDLGDDDLSGETLERISEKTQRPREW
jgi:CBS domain-containing protein